ncbi:MAG: HAD family phosphatase [Muribaculaceae bacterium]|nr:HAD family phosphatase [Muribaculaceae bacterium]
MNDKIARCKAALFDLDGVLIDSETLYTQFWAEVGRHHHLPSPTFAYDIKGTTLTDILETHFPSPEVRADVDRLLHEFEDNVVYPIFPGALEFVDALRSKGLKTVIVTSSDERKMEFLYAQHPTFRSHFDDVVTAADVTHSKPDPEPYLVGAAKAGCRPEECVVFEDSYQGLQAGRSAGAFVVGLSTTNPASGVARYADMVVGSLAELSD